MALRKGTLRAPVDTTVGDAAETLIAGMADGSILGRGGKPYKPSAQRSYASALRLRVIPQLGHLRLSAVQRRDVQQFADLMRAQGLSPSTVRNTLDPLRVIYRQGKRRDEVTLDPTEELELPSLRGRRDRIDSPDKAERLIDALPQRERAFWCTAFYAGLRRGELRASRWSNVDLDRNVLRVDHAWDDVEGEIDVRTEAGWRVAPLSGRLRRELAAHKLATGRGDEDLVFGGTRALPFVPSTVRARANRAWTGAGLDPLSPHEARHCAVSYFIAAGMNPKQISTYVGHGDVRQTWNRYGHLMPGDEAQAASRLDAFLERWAK